MRVLVLGASGMLGHTLISELPKRDGLHIIGAARQIDRLRARRGEKAVVELIGLRDATDVDELSAVVDAARPELVINCVGVIKQNPATLDAVASIQANSVLPHQLARLLAPSGARLVQISTDCVYAGNRGNYSEADPPDATDLYGHTKLLGELTTPRSITLRTSMVGHEMGTAVSLVDWFLAQGSVSGFVNAIYSGLTTVELARVIAEYVIPNEDLAGLFHVSAPPISKYDLLQLVAREYKWPGKLSPQTAFHCNRSLNGDRFRAATGYLSPSWPTMIRELHEFHARWVATNALETQ